MPLPKLRQRLRDQTLHRRLSKWEISLKDFFKARNATNKLTRRIKNLWVRLAKENIQISIYQVRDREHIIPELVHKSDIIQGEVLIYLDDVSTENLTLLVILKSHILLKWQGSEAGESFLVSDHVSWGTRLHEPLVLQATVHHLHRTRRDRWISAGVSEIKSRNPALNHATWGGLHSLFHLTIWPSDTWTTIGKM
jgi:hypothetical protein